MTGRDFRFDEALQSALAAIDVGPHCSCAEVTLKILADTLPLEDPAARFAAAGFGGGIGGSGGPCGAFAAGLIAMGIFVGERETPEGCIAETIESPAQTYYDAWLDNFGSIMCSDLSGFSNLRSQQDRDTFFSGGGPEKCTNNYIRFAAEQTMRLVALQLGG